jgi:hypothetical protein
VVSSRFHRICQRLALQNFFLQLSAELSKPGAAAYYFGCTFVVLETNLENCQEPNFFAWKKFERDSLTR